MATPGTTYFPATGDPVIDGTTNGYMWVLNADRTLDWSIANGFDGEYWYDPASVFVHAQAMLSMVSQYANIKFNYVGYYTTPSVAYSAGSEITLTLSASTVAFPSSSYWARAFFPMALNQAQYYYGEAGDVVLNVRSAANNLSSYAPGSAGWALFLHELGHALGLKHPHDGGGTGRPTLTQLGLADLDKDWASVMSYNDDFNWNYRQWEPATPMILDVLALQYLYGKNFATGAGASTYALTRTGMYSTIWDASGTDLVSVANQQEGWLIYLPESPISSLVDTKVGFAAPTGDFALPSPTTLYWLAGDFENANGSNAADILYGSNSGNVLNGNGGNDFIWGNGGNDAINGGTGIDMAGYSGSRSQYQMQRFGNTVTLSGPDGTDTLIDVERLQFDDVKVAIDIYGNGGQAYRLYQAAFDRTPDIAGLGFQMTALDAGWSLVNISQNFIDSPEFQRTYGNLTNTQFVNQLYLNVLHRPGEQAGVDFHVSNLNVGWSRAHILTNFSESPENQAALIGVIENGMVYT